MHHTSHHYIPLVVNHMKPANRFGLAEPRPHAVIPARDVQQKPGLQVWSLVPLDSLAEYYVFGVYGDVFAQGLPETLVASSHIAPWAWMRRHRIRLQSLPKQANPQHLHKT